MVLPEIVWKSHKTLIFQSALSSLLTAYMFTLIPLLSKGSCGSSPRRGVFFTARGAEASQRTQGLRVLCEAFAQGRRRLRVKPSRPVTARPSQRTRTPCALCEALAPFALQKHRNAVKKHANFFHTIHSRTFFLWLQGGRKQLLYFCRVKIVRCRGAI
jgi:hypothetical protein